MNNQKETIRRFINYLNNEEHLGGFWLPNIQRPFVWKIEQIERLFDSILREYPIGSLLIWKNNSAMRHRKFIDIWRDGLKLIDFYVPENRKPKMLVLDGQQRLQSLFIGLKGSYNGQELYMDILSGDQKAPEDIKYDFKFLSSPSFPYVKFKGLVFTDKLNYEIKNEIIATAGRDLSENEDIRIVQNIEIIRNVFCTQENVLYQVVDSIDRPLAYKEDDIVEIFIRANSGGTKLSKSDLLFSLLVSAWENADEDMTMLLNELNRDGFDFGRDFILKCCLVIFGKGARYEVEKFRNADTKEKIENNWDLICHALKDVKDFVVGKTFIQCDKVLTSYLALIPLVYYRYHYKNRWEKTKKMDEYLVRVLLAGAFGGSPDNLIDKIIKQIDENQLFMTNEIFGIIKNDGRNLDLSKETILSFHYQDKRIHLLFNLIYDFNYDPSYIQNEPQLDHIFPQSILRTIKIPNPETGRVNLMKYHQFDRDQLANMMLLTRQENGGGGKSYTPPLEWFDNKDDAYLEKHMIPKNKNLWKIENYEAFIEERKKLILKKIDYLLIK
ncbi:MAG: DUF262 domain-containing protein [Bacteroidales bacterium]|nr:DUF262 domain-containing protein [Bacteroidales bacterium]